MILLHCFILALGLRTVRSTYGATVLTQLPIVNEAMNADGFERIGVLTNGTFPGPVLTFNKGDRVQINVTTSLTNANMRRSTSIYWHGNFQTRSARNDSPAMITRCLIPPNQSFLYDFELGTKTGTYWYHSHLTTQYCNGLRGAFIIYDPYDPQADLYDVDNGATIIQLADYYHIPAPALHQQFFKDAIAPIPDAGIINANERYAGGPVTAFALVNVEAGERYRLRFINIVCQPVFRVPIDQHNFTLIEADGNVHVPHTGSFSDQRYPAILTANQPVANHWIRAPSTVSSVLGSGNPKLDANPTLAILRYSGAAVAEPDGSTNSTATDLLLEQDLSTLIDPGSPGGDVSPDFSFTMNIGVPKPPYFEINGVSFKPRGISALLQILSGASSASDFLPHDNMVILPQNATVEVSPPRGEFDPRPIHFHGHAFDVVRSANSNVVNYQNPPQRDVVGVGSGNTAFRFYTRNPGPWFLDCHIDWHLEAALAVFGEAPRSGNDSVVTSMAWSSPCPIYDTFVPSLQ